MSGNDQIKLYNTFPDENVTATKTTKTRFWIMIIFSLLSFLRTVLWNTWGPITESVEAAFGWSSSTVSMTVNLTVIMFAIFVVPMCIAIQRFGLRYVTLLSSALMVIGTALRCITTELPWVTVTCNICAVLLGITSTFTLSGPSFIACEWFPLDERTTAVAVMAGATQLGGVGSYLEPLLVRRPGPGVSIDEIKHDILILDYIGTGVAAALFVVILIYFPSKPSFPPSLSSSTDRLNISSGVVSLIKNKDFLLVLLSYGVTIGPPIAWMPLLNYSLLPLGFHQDQTMWICILAILMSSVFPVVFGRFIDHFRHQMRTSLIILMLLSSFCFYWFLLLSYGIIPLSTWQIYLSVVGGMTFNYTSLPLFLELTAEMAYPVPEILVSGIMIGADNVISTFFLLVFLIPDVGYLWITSTMVLCTSLTILPLMAAKIDFKRTDLTSMPMLEEAE